MMARAELLAALGRLKVETGSLACLGCGYEHRCTTQGCAILRAAAEALAALRPVSRERVERRWFREPYSRLETKYRVDVGVVYSAVNTCMACGHETPIGHFCHNCGAALDHMGVQMVMERMEALKDD